MPQKTLSLSSDAVAGSTAIATTIGANMVAVRCAGTGNGQQRTMPLRIPDDFDVSYSSFLSVDLAAFFANATPNLIATIALYYTVATLSGVVTDYQLVAYWPVPNPWPTADVRRFTFDDGSGRSIAPHQFKPDDLVGFALIRFGSDANDTYPDPLVMAAGVRLTYHQRCQRCCCP